MSSRRRPPHYIQFFSENGLSAPTSTSSLGGSRRDTGVSSSSAHGISTSSSAVPESVSPPPPPQPVTSPHPTPANPSMGPPPTIIQRINEFLRQPGHSDLKKLNPQRPPNTFW